MSDRNIAVADPLERKFHDLSRRVRQLQAKKKGVGFESYTVGDILYANTASTLARLADVATGNALISGGVGVAPSWGKIGLTTHITGTLGIANGGTGLTALDAISFTPSWTNLSVGNGSQTAYYWQLGKLMVIGIQLTFGSTTSITGLPRFTIPNGGTARSIMPASTIGMRDASVPEEFFGYGEVISGGTTIDVYVVNAAATRARRENVSSTVPMTWTTSDELRIGVATMLV